MSRFMPISPTSRYNNAPAILDMPHPSRALTPVKDSERPMAEHMRICHRAVDASASLSNTLESAVRMEEEMWPARKEDMPVYIVCGVYGEHGVL
jgi:hypothetical protein